METITEAKEHLRANWEQGTKCPACGQYVKLYERKLNTGMAIFLIGMYKKTLGGAYIHASEVLSGTKSLDYSLLRHWKLIEEMPGADNLKRRSGLWRVTAKGKSFVEESLSVPSHAKLYNNVLVGYSDYMITIKEALGKKFSYDELMHASPPRPNSLFQQIGLMQ